MAVRLLVGLGNPGPRYELTRHNAGFLLADRLADGAAGAALLQPWKEWRGQGEAAAVEAGGRRVWLLKPGTFMNDSGRAAGAFAAFHKVAPEEVLACFDDLALPLGRLRLRLAGSAGGHNGMQSLIDHLGTDQVPRLRLGIGPLPPGRDGADFVLSRFAAGERKALEEALERAASAAVLAVEKGVEAAMNRFNPAGEPAQ